MPKLTAEQLTGISSSHIVSLSESIGLQSEVLNAWQLMQTAAKNDGIELAIASGFRSFSRQLAIWNNKFDGVSTVKSIDNTQVDIQTLEGLDKLKAILLYSALPGTSRHHWGTDIDIYAPNLLSENQKLQLEPWEYERGGPFHQLSIWLEQHCQHFGFYFPYDKYRQGVAPEPWHLSFKPLAKQYQQLLTPEIIISVLTSQQIAGFDIIKQHIDYINRQYIQNVG